MEIIYIRPDSVRIKSKAAQFVAGVHDAKDKNEYDAHLSFENLPVVEQPHVIFSGPGEYEVKGVKMTGLGKAELIGFVGKIEGITVCITKASYLSHSKDMSECDIVVLFCDTHVESSQLANLSAKVIVAAGPEAETLAKDLQHEITPVNKFVITRDKLPTELQLVVLG